jgi:hypothetical protein
VPAFTLAGLLFGCGPQASPGPQARAVAATGACGAAGDACLDARLRGAIDADLAWSAAELQCEGGARPDGRGIRVSLAGPLDARGRRVRLVFGMAAPPGAASNRAVPTNLTLIVEGEHRLFATLGDDKCSVDALEQRPASASTAAGAAGDYWVSARGFCVEPASTLDGTERVLLSRFDFKGRIHLEDVEPRAHADDI